MAEARRRPSPATAAALAAARHPEIDAALAELGQPVPAWATQAAPEPVRVWRAVNTSRSQERWLVGCGDHLLVESVSHPGSTLVREVSAADRGVARRYDAMLKGEETLGSRVEVPLDEALREMPAALRATELTWPREPSASDAEHPLLALAPARDGVRGQGPSRARSGSACGRTCSAPTRARCSGASPG